MTPALFAPFTLKGVTLRNRIAASPMCQYRAQDGFLNDWHETHYTALARGGVGLVVVEATAVTPQGRITPGDAGLWSDAHTAGFKSVARRIKAAGAVPGIQLAHAGRKAGCQRPWDGGAPLDKADPQAWQPIAPSAVPYMPDSDHVPREMTEKDIGQTKQAFVDASRRARAAGFEWLELHFAHGFLGQNFLSRHANLRHDRYGGSLENRARLLIEVVQAVREVWPEQYPLTMRLGVVEFDDGQLESLSEAIQVLNWCKEAGLDLVDVGLALSTPGEQVPWGPNFMVSFAAQIRKATGLPVTTSWMITDPHQANEFIRDEQVDLLFFARTLLANPHWPYAAARELKLKAPAQVLPTPYSFWLQAWTN